MQLSVSRRISFKKMLLQNEQSEFYFYVFKKILFSNEASTSNLRFDHELEMILPEGLENSQFLRKSQQINESAINRHSHRTKLYSGWSLRPIPSTRGEYFPGSAPAALIKLRKGCK